MRSGTPSPLVRFATFEVNIEIGELRRYGHRLKLQDKPFQILVALLERPGGLVSREELHQRLWSADTFVDFDHNLNNAVDKLRKALNDSAEQPKFIETLPRRGYRFIAQVERPVLSTVSLVGASVEAGKIEVAEASSALASPIALNATQPQRVRIDRDQATPQVPGSRRKLLVGSSVGACLALALLFAAVRFYAPAKLFARSANGKGRGIQSLVIEKDGALNPIDMGFKLHSIGRYDSDVMRNSLNHGFDRWRIASDDQTYYYRTLTAPEKEFAVVRDWKLVCVCSIQVGGAWANIDFGNSGRRFDIELLQEGDKYFVGLTKQISPNFEFSQKIEFPGIADINHPHTYELRYNHVSQTASLWIDGQMMASGYRGHTQFVEDRGLMFGSGIYLTSKTSVGIFRSVRFEVH
jgi:DNA-binding winged helix-turn-helix (wHTH) protein